jgi:hypothetical protein
VAFDPGKKCPPAPERDWIELKAMGTKPSATVVAAVFASAVVSMLSAVYFGGNGQLPLAMTGTGLFVILGGVGFELARRRS